MLEELRQRLRRLEKPPGLADGPAVLPLGEAQVDAVLGGGLMRGALHEIAAAGESHIAAATGFAVGVACLVIPGRGPSARLRASSTHYGPRNRDPDTNSELASGFRVPTGACHRAALRADPLGRPRNDGVCLWIAEDMAALESGAPYGPGLDDFGLVPERLITVAVAQRRDLLWAMEEALRCRAVACVVGEMRHGALDTVAVRRLSLAAAESGALALLLRAAPEDDASTAATRWMVGAPPLGGEGGRARFAVALLRNRRGPRGQWILEWSDSDGRFTLAAHAQPVAQPPRHRPHRQVRSVA